MFNVIESEIENTELSSGLSVALLLSELEDVKEITTVFRKLGIIPHFYEDLKSFWGGTLERAPALAIVDVKKMSEGELILKNHPSVSSEDLPLLFFYSEKTEPLLFSTQELYHLGTLKKASTYESTLKGILKRLNKVIQLEQENLHLKFTVEAKNSELKMAEKDKVRLIKTDHYQSLSKQICLKLDEYRFESDFFIALEKVIQATPEFSEFGMVELSFNGQKLISPISHVRKFRAIPSLWLGQVCKDGIEPFAQNMANQVALEVLGGEIVSLFIKGENGKPEKILFIKTSDELCFSHFDWQLFESFLNGFYTSFKLRLRQNQNSDKKFKSTFDALSFLDQFVFGGIIQDEPLHQLAKIEYRLVNIDLSEISDVCLKHNTQRFYWKKFKDDFLAKLDVQSRVEFNVFENGVTDISFLVKAPDLDYFFDEVKDYTTKFAYWKYFENTDTALFLDVKPTVKMIPLSAFAYLKSKNDRLINLIDQAKKDDHEIINNIKKENKINTHFNIQWNRAGEHEV
jgi:hypothetical protein